MKTNSWRMIFALVLAAMLWSNISPCRACTPPPPPSLDTTYIIDSLPGNYDLSNPNNPSFWPAQYTYHITANLTISKGTLIIEPGAIIKLDPNIQITVCPYSGSEGYLIACGKPYQPIIFTSSHDNSLGQVVVSDYGVDSTNEYFYAVEIGTGSKIEFCHVMYAKMGIKVGGLPASKIQHNVIQNCTTGVRIQGFISSSSEKITLFNNLIYSCSHGIDIPGFWSTSGTVDLYNNTIDNCTVKGIYISSSPSSKLLMRNNLFTNMDGAGVFAIDDTDGTNDPNMRNNGFYQSNTNGINSLGSNNQNSSNGFTVSPYDSTNTVLGSHYLNADASGGGKLVNAGSQSVSSAGYGDGKAWAIKNPSTVITTDPNYTADPNWDPDYTGCDTSGDVDIGYHHPRVDVLIYHSMVTAANGSTPFTFTINPGTVVAQFPVRGTNGDYIDINSNCSLSCTGDPFGNSEVVFVQGALVSESGVDAYYHRYDPFLIIDNDAGAAAISHAKFLAVSQAIQALRSVAVENCTFWMNGCAVTDSYDVFEGTDTSTLANCLFIENGSGVYLPSTTANMQITNCSFAQEDMPGSAETYVEGTCGVYGETGCTFSVVNCLFDELEYGLAGVGNCTENNNAFYHVYDPTQFNGDTLSSTDWTHEHVSGTGDLVGNPFIAQADWANNSDNRFYLNQSSKAVDNGNSTTGVEGGSTDITFPLDIATIDIGYHYPRYTVYVDRNATGTNSGTSWEDAYLTIQSGITNTGKPVPEAVLVADGTYTGTGNKNLDFNGKAMVLKSLNGPFACIIDCQSSGQGICFQDGETNNTIVDGFTIRNGNATSGGGILITSSSKPVIMNCVIKNCQATMGGGICASGGGLYSYIINCVIANNNASNRGGGIYWENPGAGFVINCTIASNGGSYGGGVYVETCACITSNSIVWDNSASYGQELYYWGYTGYGYVWGGEIYCSSARGGYNVDLHNYPYCRWYNYPNHHDGTSFMAGTAYNYDPLFPSSDTYIKTTGNGSTCINAGDNNFYLTSVPASIKTLIKTDILGNPRIQGGTVDLGAYEIE